MGFSSAVNPKFRLISGVVALATTSIFCFQNESFADEMPITVVIQDDDIRNVIQKLRKQYIFPICFELEELDPLSQGITATEAVASMKENQLSVDKEKLTFMEGIEKDNPNTIVGWRLEKYSFLINARNVNELLSQLERNVQNYHFRLDNGYVVVVPKKSPLSLEIPSISFSDTTIGDVMERIQGSLSKQGIVYIENRLANPGGSLSLISSEAISHLSLETPTLHELLTRVAQAASTPVVWNIAGPKGSRILSFERCRNINSALQSAP